MTALNIKNWNDYSEELMVGMERFELSTPATP